jgi:hypothetical protein
MISDQEGCRRKIRPQTSKGMAESITSTPRRSGAWLALLAVALQLGLSIGHFHNVVPDWGRAAGLGWAKPIIGPGDDRSPAGKPSAPAEDQCPICFGLAVSGAFVLTAALCFILAIVPETARLDAVRQPTLLARRHFSPAQQRAPPPVAIPV